MTKLAYNSNNKITNTGILYYGKNLYYQTLSGRLRENFIDLWYSKPLYGKVDTDFNFVGAPSTNLKISMMAEARKMFTRWTLLLMHLTQ